MRVFVPPAGGPPLPNPGQWQDVGTIAASSFREAAAHVLELNGIIQPAETLELFNAGQDWAVFIATENARPGLTVRVERVL